jgi:hypothetical protein
MTAKKPRPKATPKKGPQMVPKKKSAPGKAAKPQPKPARAAAAVQVVFATYRVREGKEAEFRSLLSRHWAVLRKLKLVTATRPVFYERQDEERKTVYVEIFSWLNDEAVGKAHHHPDVMAIWGAMETLVEERLGRPKFEFPHFDPMTIKLARP